MALSLRTDAMVHGARGLGLGRTTAGSRVRSRLCAHRARCGLGARSLSARSLARALGVFVRTLACMVRVLVAYRFGNTDSE